MMVAGMFYLPVTEKAILNGDFCCTTEFNTNVKREQVMLVSIVPRFRHLVCLGFLGQVMT